MNDLLWNHEVPVTNIGVDVPVWIEQDISGQDIAAIVQGGCASGAYMPAVAYHQAQDTMQAHGDAVLQFIEDQLGELPQVPGCESWAGIAVYFLSMAVELWASGIEDEVTDLLDEQADD